MHEDLLGDVVTAHTQTHIHTLHPHACMHIHILSYYTYTHAIASTLGLCIELWKVTKVVQINIDSENLIAGVIPRISFVDRPSYESSTKEYDMVRETAAPRWILAVGLYLSPFE